MTWYAAHLIQYFKLKDRPQSTFPVWENVVLIEADSLTNAFSQADEIGQTYYGHNDDSLRLNDQPALSIFAGIRKLVECQEIVSNDLDYQKANSKPGHGTEITYIELEVNSQEALDKLVGGNEVEVVYDEIRYTDEETT